MDGLRRPGRAAALLLAALLALGVAAPGPAGLADVTADAVTAATTVNPSTGQAAWLTDGRTPDDDAAAAPLAWEGVGMVTVAWPDSVRLTRIRAWVDGLQRYRVFGYLGGGFDEYGDRVEVETAVYGREDQVPAGTRGWFEIDFPAEGAIDNLSFQVIDGGALYELRFATAAPHAGTATGCRGPLPRR